MKNSATIYCDGEPTSPERATYVDAVYGLFPAFILSTTTLIVVSLLTKPPEGVDDHFESFNKPLSALSSSDDPTGTPEYVTDGGRDVDPKAVTETDTIRAHVEESNYWNSGED
ncbi:SSS sodium solute transporter superfamily protein [Natrinema versiforme JCM 10478]|uniref:SSS sodium solute transporter superfamily protein n=1 Tax=Natrinema versiforme JCM 10478 TaxID=1227496 RepID=L9XPB3_9EURY|nr:hypothetical protein [Natrinema versiforme]ELY63271.1 SSS sodium solute transporter superfamily protein [Natrinema versiforme JCM 10478]